MFTSDENRMEVIDLSSPAMFANDTDITESLLFDEIEVPSEMFLGCDTPRDSQLDDCVHFLKDCGQVEEMTPVSSLVSQAEHWKKDSAVSVDIMSPVLASGVYVPLGDVMRGVADKIIERSVDTVRSESRLPPTIGVQMRKPVTVEDGCIMTICASLRLKTGLLCGWHQCMREEMVVKKSRVKDAGVGLFSGCSIPPGGVVPGVIVYGELITRSEASGRDSGIIIQLDDFRFIDVSVGNSLCKYVNDYRGSGFDGPNAIIEKYSVGVEGRVQFLLVATEFIPEGGEIYIDYGEDFWKGYRKREIDGCRFMEIMEVMSFAEK